MYEFCQRKRHLELKALKRAVDVVDRKRAEKQLKNGKDRTASTAKS